MTERFWQGERHGQRHRHDRAKSLFHSKISWGRGLTWRSSGWDSVLLLQGAWVLSLVKELRSICCMVWPKKEIEADKKVECCKAEAGHGISKWRPDHKEPCSFAFLTRVSSLRVQQGVCVCVCVLLYSVVLVSAIQQGESAISIHIPPPWASLLSHLISSLYVFTEYQAELPLVICFIHGNIYFEKELLF